MVVVLVVVDDVFDLLSSLLLLLMSLSLLNMFQLSVLLHVVATAPTVSLCALPLLMMLTLPMAVLLCHCTPPRSRNGCCSGVVGVVINVIVSGVAWRCCLGDRPLA